MRSVRKKWKVLLRLLQHPVMLSQMNSKQLTFEHLKIKISHSPSRTVEGKCFHCNRGHSLMSYHRLFIYFLVQDFCRYAFSLSVNWIFRSLPNSDSHTNNQNGQEESVGRSFVIDVFKESMIKYESASLISEYGNDPEHITAHKSFICDIAAAAAAANNNNKILFICS